MLKEIQALTPACEEVQQGDVKEKQVRRNLCNLEAESFSQSFRNSKKISQVFVRRILQVGSELQDARDVLQDLCRPPTLTPRQFEFVFATTGRGSDSDDDEDNDGGGCDPYLDPSVRFFGLDWQQLFGRCLSLSLNLRLLGQQLSTPGLEVDLMLLSGIRRDLARVEVDVTSHGEAVLHGRLSKSQQMLILQEQSRVALLTPTAQAPKPKVSKSRSFRDSSRQRQATRYRKARTTDLNKLSAQLDASGRSQEEIRGEWREVMDQTRREEEQEKQQQGSGSGPGSRKSSFMQNVSSLLKHIR